MGQTDDEYGDAAPSPADLSAVPLFPLPNVVLFPRAVLPLHIFEERYKQMTADALAGDRLVAMALLRPGWERGYYSRPAIEPVVCVGRILSAERLPDGKYNFLLQGLLRAEVVGEVAAGTDALYRRAELRPLRETPAMEIDLSQERFRLVSMFGHEPLGALQVVRQFRALLAGTMPTSDLLDLLAFHFLDDVPTKQSLLADPDVRARAARTIELLEARRPMLEAAARHRLPAVEMN